MAYDLAQMARSAGVRRDTTLRPVEPAIGPEQDLARLYLAVLKAWSPEAILRNYTGGLTTDAPSDQSDAIAEAENTVTRLIAEFTAGLREWVVRAETIYRSRFVASVKAGTGLDLSFMLTNGEVQETLEVFVSRNVDLVRNVSDQARGRIADAIWRGYEQRLPAREVAKEIRAATGMARDRSVRIAAHQNANLASELDRERRAEAGLTMFRYRHGGKRNFRPWHKARDGKIYDSKTGKQVNPDGSALSGGDVIEASDRPGRPPGCACREQAYLAIFQELNI